MDGMGGVCVEFRSVLIGCALSMSLAAPSWSQDPASLAGAPTPASPRVDSPATRSSEEPNKAPNYDMIRYYPAAAARANISGRAVLDCLVQAGGLLGDCKVVSETPLGWNFGEAALKMSVLFRATHRTEGSRTRIPIGFRAPH